MRNMSAWAIRHPISPIVLFVVLLFMGIVAFVRLPITLNPDIAYPLVLVQVLQPGAAPTEVETQIIQKVEGSVAGIGNIHNITSLALEGTARIFIEFNIGTPIDRAVADVRDAVAKIRVQPARGNPGAHRPTAGRRRRRHRLLRRQHHHACPSRSSPGSWTTPSPSVCSA